MSELNGRRVRVGHRVPYGGPLESKYKKNGEVGCWTWLGALNNCGYGVVRLDGRLQVAHRAVYESFGLEIPEGHELHHVCKYRECVNPAHLEPRIPEENRHRWES